MEGDEFTKEKMTISGLETHLVLPTMDILELDLKYVATLTSHKTMQY